jgi:6-phosphogluconolactonase (cycloisomerase 2 family)
MRHFRSIRILIGIAVAALVSACGGGGSGGGTPAPSGLSYPTPPTFLVGQAISPLSPKVTGVVSTYSVSPALPAGLNLSASTGVIFGTPTAMTSTASYKIEASNSGGNTAASIVLTISSRFLYASGCNWNGPDANPYFTGGIYAFSVDLATGVLSPVPGSPFAPTAGCALYSIAVGTGAPIMITHDSKFLYSVDSNSRLLAFQINSDGSLSAVSGAPFTIPGYPLFLVADLVANPTLDFLYASDPSNRVMGYAIDSATGVPSLTPVAGTNVVSPTGATATLEGRYYYQALYGSAQIVGFSTNAVTGALSPVPGSPLFLGLNQVPNDLAVDPAGKFLYVNNWAHSQQTGQGGPMHAYSIDPVSGALTDVPGSPFAVSQWPQVSVAVDATGKFLIVSLDDVSVQSNGLAVLSINPDTGALTSVPGSPFALPHAKVVVAEPSGLYVYMGGYGVVGAAVGVVAYSIDQVTGALTQTGEVPIPGNVGAIALTH